MVEAPKPKNSIEAVASADSGVRTAAIDLALLRSPTVPTDMAAVRRYFQEVIGSGDKKEAARGARIGGLQTNDLNQIWAAADALIKRAESRLRLRGARAWAYELSKHKDGAWADERVVDTLFHILEHGEHASGHIPSQLTSPAARRISRDHRGRIESGVRIYEKYLGYAKKAHGDPHDLQELLEAWQELPYVTQVLPEDIGGDDRAGRGRAEVTLRGHLRLEKMIEKSPEIKARFDSLPPEEKIIYIQYLGMSAQNRLVARSRMFPLLHDYHRMAPILAKMEGAEPYPERKKLRDVIRDVRAQRKARKVGSAAPQPASLRRPRQEPEVIPPSAQIPASEPSRALPSPEAGDGADINPEELARARKSLGLDD